MRILISNAVMLYNEVTGNIVDIHCFFVRKTAELCQFTFYKLVEKYIDGATNILNNSLNTTATLSVRMDNAQPWRFFFACNSLKLGR